MDLGTVLLLVATFGTGAVTGLFLAFSVAVMPGLRATDDAVFLSAMQRINVAIVNPVFLLVFLGSPLLLLVAALVGPRNAWLWAALALHLAGFAVTPAVNVPLNNALDAATDPGPARAAFERPWNRAHAVRTVLMAASFAACLVASVELSAA
jgi:uncharacterized membrane protein